MGGTRWIEVAGQWFYQGLSPRLVGGDNVTLIAVPERGMDAATFGRLWRGVVRDLMRVAKCVRVRVCERRVEMEHQDIVFRFEGRRYIAPGDFYVHNAARLPDGRLIRADDWFESMPPQPGGLTVVASADAYVEAREVD